VWLAAGELAVLDSRSWRRVVGDGLAMEAAVK
jgi:hypothetical protein